MLLSHGVLLARRSSFFSCNLLYYPKLLGRLVLYCLAYLNCRTSLSFPSRVGQGVPFNTSLQCYSAYSKCCF